MKKVSELKKSVAFDGVTNPYIPGERLTISPRLKLHRTFAENIDPVTYEVIRHNLWNINLEHGATIQRISGSPVAIFALDMRHKGQINEVEIALPAEQIGEGDLRTLAEQFYQRYERLYGQGSSFRGTPLEIVTFRVRATAQTPRPHLKEASAPTERISARAKRAPRRIYWADLQRAEETPIFDGAHLRPGNRIVGPAVIETNATTVVVHPGRTLAVDGFGNFEITFD